MTQHIQQLQTSVFQECQHFIKSTEIVALQENNMFWQQSTEKRQEHNPFSPTNLEIEISRVPSYIKCVQQYAES
jgi:protease II